MQGQGSIKVVASKQTRPEAGAASWIQRYHRIRSQSEVLCRPLQDEDFNLQAMPEVSPPKWHLAHTTWFFEQLWLKEFDSTYREFDPRYAQLFNSYYQALGRPFARERRGLLSRPTLDEVMTFRHEIDRRVENLLRTVDCSVASVALRRLQLGLHHEQQHQELLLTDIKYNFSVNPLLPAYLSDPMPARLLAQPDALAVNWREYPGGIVDIGVDAGSGFNFDASNLDSFAFDNESPRHSVFLQPYALADRVVSNGDYLDFIQDCGYQRPELWLADGWAKVQQQDWQAPLYWISNESPHWRSQQEDWQVFTLYGLSRLHPADPVCHLSYYEADAYARWVGARLPTEAEWENAASRHKFEGHFLDDGVLHPRASCPGQTSPRQLFGDVWEWTASSYAPYPGFRSANGAVGEYNGKFMCNQMVLRGGSCVSERDHVRATYRNFFYPWDRWQFSGVRLARDIKG